MQKVHRKNTWFLICVLLLLTGCGEHGRQQTDTGFSAQAVIHAWPKQHLRAASNQRWGLNAMDQTESSGFSVTDNRCGIELVRYESKEAFLKENGFADETPFYQLFDEDSGALMLELYYDESNKTGGGLYYCSPGVGEAQGFLFNGMDKQQYSEKYGDRSFKEVTDRAGADPFMPVSPDGYDAARDTEFEAYQEEILYAGNGKPLVYRAWGFVEHVGVNAEGAIMDIVRIQWKCREDGSLKYRSYYRNENVYGPVNHIITGDYDTQGRVVYECGYIMHGFLNHYYIYSGNNTMPDYYLYIDDLISQIHVMFLEI